MTTQTPISSFDITDPKSGPSGGIRVAADLHRDRLEVRLSSGILAACSPSPNSADHTSPNPAAPRAR